MPIAVLVPTLDSAAIGERFIGSHVRAILGSTAAELRIYHPSERARDVTADIESAHVLVVTDPLMLPSPNLAGRLLTLLERTTADAVLPSTNLSEHQVQRRTPGTFVTARELASVTTRLEEAAATVTTAVWDASDPVAWLCPASFLDESRRPLREVLERHEVAISANDYVHRWMPESTARLELLRLVPTTARNILEIGCADGFLGQTVRQRQKCRYVGIESDPQHAAIARRHVDEIYRGDAEELVSILNERFDCIVVADAWQFVAEPWAFLAALHRLAAPGGALVVSATNASNASIVNDLLHGVSPLVVASSASAAAARPLTRSAFTQIVAAAGWSVSNVLGYDPPAVESHDRLVATLANAQEYALDELRPLRYHLLATSGSAAA